MDALPYYKWLWIDYRANRKVQRMSWQAKGLYRELLDEFWSEGYLPDDIGALADICGCKRAEMAKFWPEIAPCFEVTENGLVNGKMDEQRTKQDKARVAMSRGGANGGRASNSSTREKANEANPKPTLEDPKPTITSPEAQPDIAEQEHKQSRAEQEHSAHEDVSGIVIEAILSHPRAQLISMHELDVRPKDTAATLDAVDAEAERSRISKTMAADMIRDRTRAIAEGVPRDQWKFIKPIDEFMRDRQYRLEPQDLTRSGNAANRGNQTERVSAAAERGIKSRDHIREAVARRLGHNFGDVDGGDAGQPPKAGATRGDAGDVAGAVGRDRGEVRPGDVQGIVIEAPAGALDAGTPRDSGRVPNTS